MRRLPPAAAFVLLLLAAPSHAATLPFTATLSLQIGTLPGAVFTGSGVAQSMGLGNSFTLPANVFSGSISFTKALFTGVPLISGLKVNVTGNAAGSFNPGFTPPLLHPTALWPGSPPVFTSGVTLAGGGIGGAMAVGGSAGVNVLMLATLPVPLTVLGTGSTIFTNAGAVSIQVIATQWTTGPAKALYATAYTFHGPMSGTFTSFVDLTMTGSDNRTPGGQGTVTLVSPVKVLTNVSGNLAVVARLTVNFIPEPGTLVLFAAGLVGLAALGSRVSRQD